jgi:SOS response regulatory protein OraA/RecX
MKAAARSSALLTVSTSSSSQKQLRNALTKSRFDPQQPPVLVLESILLNECFVDPRQASRHIRDTRRARSPLQNFTRVTQARKRRLLPWCAQANTA